MLLFWRCWLLTGFLLCFAAASMLLALHWLFAVLLT